MIGNSELSHPSASTSRSNLCAMACSPSFFQTLRSSNHTPNVVLAAFLLAFVWMVHTGTSLSVFLRRRVVLFRRLHRELPVPRSESKRQGRTWWRTQMGAHLASGAYVFATSSPAVKYLLSECSVNPSTSAFGSSTSLKGLRPFTTSTGFPRIWPVANLLPFMWTGLYPIIFFHVPDNFFFIVTTTGQELGHWLVSRFSNLAKLWNAIMKEKLHMFAIHQTATSSQWTNYLNPRTSWYPALDESNRMKSAYFIIHLGKNPPPQNGCRLKSVLFFKTSFSHPPLSEFNLIFHKTNGKPLH